MIDQSYSIHFTHCNIKDAISVEVEEGSATLFGQDYSHLIIIIDIKNQKPNYFKNIFQLKIY